MEVVVTSAEMQACDRAAIETLKIPGLVLMENAGRGVVDVMEKHFGRLAGKKVTILCGKGNNGGDGFVVARHLFNRGTNVTAVLIGRGSELKNDARTNYEALRNMARSYAKDGMLRLVETKSLRRLRTLGESDFVVDAIFGTGFTGEVRGHYKQFIDWINDRAGQKISIDIPSGVNADNGSIGNVAVRSDLTMTMGLKKVGLVTGEAISYTGRIEVIDISIPQPIVHPPKHKTFIIHGDDVRNVLPMRPLNAHKHSIGKIFVLAGSRGLTGAAAMTATSAMRAGAGAVILGTPASVYPILAKKLTEVMTEPLPETDAGSISLTAYDAIRKHLEWSDLLILGPGLSRNEETRQLVWKLTSEYDKPMLIDADGLNNLAEDVSHLRKHRSKEIIITPHTGELSRLIGKSSGEIEGDRVAVARDVAKQFKLTLVLKGAPTVTASEDGMVYINSTGNPGMATAGSGDVLSGIIGGLWAQGMKRTNAAYLGVFIHGRAGDRAKEKYGEKSLLATDIQQMVSLVLQQIEAGIDS